MIFVTVFGHIWETEYYSYSYSVIKTLFVREEEEEKEKEDKFGEGKYLTNGERNQLEEES